MSSALQWYEALNKGPIEEMFDRSDDSESSQGSKETYDRAAQIL